MSTAHNERVPALTLGWRLKMSMDAAGLSRKDMAREMDVTESTISRWTNDGGKPPKRPNLVLWSQVTRVPLAWLEHGAVVEDPDPGEPVDRPEEVSNALDQLAARKRRRAGVATTGRYLVVAVAA
jgi:transcriptional regulator with XRE-family HTH domain